MCPKHFKSSEKNFLRLGANGEVASVHLNNLWKNILLQKNWGSHSISKTKVLEVYY